MLVTNLATGAYSLESLCSFSAQHVSLDDDGTYIMVAAVAVVLLYALLCPITPCYALQCPAMTCYVRPTSFHAPLRPAVPCDTMNYYNYYF